MKRDSEPRPTHPRWPEEAERMLEDIPGVVSARLHGPREAVSEVAIWYEPAWPVGDVVRAVHDCLTGSVGASLGSARLHAIVAHPDRRMERRARPARAGENSVGAAAAFAPLRLIGYRLEKVRPGVVGVEVWIAWDGRTFSGAALGPDSPPGSLRTPALATLRALHSCLQVLYEGPLQPGLVLESVVQVRVAGSPVAVVTLTASENARPLSLVSASADEGGADLAVVLATLHATSRTFTRWLTQGRPEKDPPRSGGRDAAGARPKRTTGTRFTLLDYAVDHGPAGDVGVGVRLAGFGESVDRRRTGSDDEAARLCLGASATLDAVHELLRIGGWREGGGGDLRHAGAHRVRAGDQDVVVVLAEASTNGARIPLAGATSADSGVERASITAALQATNPFVADRMEEGLLPAGSGGTGEGPRLARA